MISIVTARLVRPKLAARTTRDLPKTDLQETIFQFGERLEMAVTANSAAIPYPDVCRKLGMEGGWPVWFRVVGCLPLRSELPGYERPRWAGVAQASREETAGMFQCGMNSRVTMGI